MDRWIDKYTVGWAGTQVDRQMHRCMGRYTGG